MTFFLHQETPRALLVAGHYYSRHGRYDRRPKTWLWKNQVREIARSDDKLGTRITLDIPDWLIVKSSLARLSADQ